MVVLGIVLVLVAVGGGALLYFGTVEQTSVSDLTTLTILGGNVRVSPLGLVLAGALVMLLLWLGFVCLRLAFRRGRKRKAAAREAEARVAAEQAEAQRQAAERGAAQRALAEQRGRTTGPPPPGASGSATSAPTTTSDRPAAPESELPPPPPRR